MPLALPDLDIARVSDRSTSVPGSKGAAGAWQRIASLLPPHAVFLEVFAGGAAVTRNKRPATEKTVLYEIDHETCAALRAAMRDRIRCSIDGTRSRRMS
jgi:site-specific DNA-adenine methylase